MDKAIGQASAVIDTELVKLARNLATNVGRAEDRFDKLLTSLEARYRGTEVRRVDGNGHVTTTLVGGLLNQPGVDEARRQQLLQQLTAEEGRLTIAREKAVAAARELDKAEQGKTETAAEAAAHFKTAVIGAEGTGPNLLGSSAAGFGQFMPKTWLTYFNRLFPDKAGAVERGKARLPQCAGSRERCDRPGHRRLCRDFLKKRRTAGYPRESVCHPPIRAAGDRQEAAGRDAAPKRTGERSDQQSSAVRSARRQPVPEGDCSLTLESAIAGRIGDSSAAPCPLARRRSTRR
jgi:hypothetical protein